MLDQMILARESITPLAGAVLDGTVPEDGVVHAGLVALQVCEAGEGFATVVAGEGFGWSVYLVRHGLEREGEWVVMVGECWLTWLGMVNPDMNPLDPGCRLAWGLPRHGWYSYRSCCWTNCGCQLP